MQPTPTTPAVVQVSVDDDPSWGSEDAPVTIIEFGDYQ
jgi:protein-disulfide isomerase